MSPEKTTFAKLLISRIEKIQDQLDSAPASAAQGDRHQRRWPYRRPNTAATVRHPGGGVTNVLTHTRSIWCEGITAICSGFMHPGSLFKTALPSRNGDPLSVSGSVVECRHVEGPFHEIEVKFDQRIDPHLFIDAARSKTGESATPIDLPNLCGKVLHLDDSEADARLLMHYLRGSAIDLKSVRNSADAVECLRKTVFDIFLCDFHLGGGDDSIAVVKTARAEGFAGPIVMMSAETNAIKLAAMKAVGAEHVLAKPYQKSALVQMMVKLHEQVGAITDGEVIYSTMGEEPEIDELLANYVSSVQQISECLQSPLIARDLNAVRGYCLNVRGSASGYGFTPLELAAEDALRALDATMSVGESRPQLRRLILRCGQLGLRRSVNRETKQDADWLV